MQTKYFFARETKLMAPICSPWQECYKFGRLASDKIQFPKLSSKSDLCPGFVRLLAVAGAAAAAWRDRVDHPPHPLAAHHGRGRQGVRQAQDRREGRERAVIGRQQSAAEQHKLVILGTLQTVSCRHPRSKEGGAEHSCYKLFRYLVSSEKLILLLQAFSWRPLVNVFVIKLFLNIFHIIVAEQFVSNSISNLLYNPTVSGLCFHDIVCSCLIFKGSSNVSYIIIHLRSNGFRNWRTIILDTLFLRNQEYICIAIV